MVNEEFATVIMVPAHLDVMPGIIGGVQGWLKAGSSHTSNSSHVPYRIRLWPEVHVKPLLTLIAALRTNVGRLWRSVFSLAFLHTICVTFCVSALEWTSEYICPRAAGKAEEARRISH